MSNTTVIIDYGSGNLHSAQKSFERAARENGDGTRIELTNSPEKIRQADRIVLPGVGAYADCLSGLEAIEGLHETLEEMVLQEKRPFLGICVGMQLMSTEGHEHGVTKGLGWLGGKVVPIKPNDPHLKIPHMGWNTLKVNITGSDALTGGRIEEATSVSNNPHKIHPVLEGIPLGPNGLHAYFVHSYHFEVENPAHRLLVTEYGGEITAMVGRDNIIGTQFHPEKSQTLGLKLISNFLKWTPA
ncbi:MAG: imidazole glycerol phosphate synthase subunit HisH [Rhodomicrobium sp.]|nr:MAG: imidazole glycerol phosphate synthase subunit HisH [Rhodomicrobium sp.]